MILQKSNEQKPFNKNIYYEGKDKSSWFMLFNKIIKKPSRDMTVEPDEGNFNLLLY